MKPSLMITLIYKDTITCLQHPRALLHLHLHLLKPCVQVHRALSAEIQVLQEVLALQQIHQTHVLQQMLPYAPFVPVPLPFSFLGPVSCICTIAPILWVCERQYRQRGIDFRVCSSCCQHRQKASR